MIGELVELTHELRACRRAAQGDPQSPCHWISRVRCHDLDMDAGLVYPAPDQLSKPVEILLVGINPNWSLLPGAPLECASPAKNTGSAFLAYERTILSAASEAMPEGSMVACADLVPCGTPGGRYVLGIVNDCRAKFFDRTLRILQPKVIVAIGRYASEQLYRYNACEGLAGRQWPGLKKRHATIERAMIGEHEGRLVFVLQPSSRVSREKREAARDAVLQAYTELM